MREIFLSIWEDIALYNNHRYLIPIFLVALLFLWGLERNKTVRRVYVYAVTALIIVFLCPLYAKIAFLVDEEIYYRVWWIIPMGVIICYSFVKVMFLTKNIWKRAVVLLFAVVIIVWNGRLVYTNSIHFKSANAYHLPEFVIHVGDYVTSECENPSVIFTVELLPFIRQYKSGIMTPFTRFYFGELGEMSDPLYLALKAEVYEIETIVNGAKEHSSLYVVLSSFKQKDADILSYGYELVYETDGYEIYRDEAIYNALVDCGVIAK